jgi:hypothetical protein
MAVRNSFLDAGADPSPQPAAIAGRSYRGDILGEYGTDSYQASTG